MFTILVEKFGFCALILFLPIFFHGVSVKIQRWKFIKATGCLPAQRTAPVKDPFIGLDFIYDSLFGRNPERYVDSTHQAHRKLGTTYVAQRRTWDTMYTCDSQNIRHVLASGFEDFELPGLRVSAMASLLGKGIFTLNGQSWSHARGILRPSFAKKNMGSAAGIFEQHLQALLRQIPRSGTVDLQPLFFCLTMDIATEFLMGHSTNMLSGADMASEQQFVDDYMTCSTEIVRMMQAGPLQHLMFNSSARRAKTRVFKYIDHFTDASLERTRSTNGEHDLIRQLSAVAKDRKTLRDQILHILLASRDTTASLLSNLFFVLAKKPHVYARVREEVLTVAGNDAPSNDQLKGMPYLKWCVQECKFRRVR